MWSLIKAANLLWWKCNAYTFIRYMKSSKGHFSSDCFLNSEAQSIKNTHIHRSGTSPGADHLINIHLKKDDSNITRLKSNLPICLYLLHSGRESWGKPGPGSMLSHLVSMLCLRRLGLYLLSALKFMQFLFKIVAQLAFCVGAALCHPPPAEILAFKTALQVISESVPRHLNVE